MRTATAVLSFTSPSPGASPLWGGRPPLPRRGQAGGLGHVQLGSHATDKLEKQKS